MTKVLFTIENNIATITLNFPEKHNVLNPETILLLSEAYHSALHQELVQVIILKANGKHFCAGADLSHMLAMSQAPFRENLDDAKKLADLFYLIYSSKKPTIACIQGNIRGGGLGLAAVNDIVVAEKNTTFAFTEVKLGLLPAVISPFILQRMNFHAAKYKMLTAETFDAIEGQRLQLIDHICDAQDALITTIDLAKKLCEHPLSALEKTKQWLQHLHPITHIQLDEAAHMLAKARQSTITKNHLQDFLKK